VADDVRLDIGCGGRGTHWDGFIGVDILPAPPEPEPVTDRPYIQLDFVHDRLPWEDGTVNEIIALHVVEHLERQDGRLLIQRALRLLRPGRRLTVTCPDLRLLATWYLSGEMGVDGGDRSSPNWRGATCADRFNWIVHCYGHKWAYDLQSLTLLAVEAGAFINDIRPVNLTGESAYAGKKNHECGVEIIARGDEVARSSLSVSSVELEHRIQIWHGREKRGLKNR